MPNSFVNGLIKTFFVTLVISNLCLYLLSLNEGKEVLRYNGSYLKNLLPLVRASHSPIANSVTLYNVV